MPCSQTLVSSLSTATFLSRIGSCSESTSQHEIESELTSLHASASLDMEIFVEPHPSEEDGENMIRKLATLEVRVQKISAEWLPVKISPFYISLKSSRMITIVLIMIHVHIVSGRNWRRPKHLDVGDGPTHFDDVESLLILKFAFDSLFERLPAKTSSLHSSNRFLANYAGLRM